jgi:hypothetical protein
MFLVYDTVAEDVYIGDDLCEIWQVSFPEGVNKLRLKGRELNLLQFHFHTPSEHAFDGLRFPMEAHLVHRTCFSTAFGRLCSFCFNCLLLGMTCFEAMFCFFGLSSL